MLRMLAPMGVLLGVLAGSTGCGPVTSTSTMNHAVVAVEEARLEQAEEYAIYEWVSAEAYLDKAREEWAHSDYQHAEEYAQKALDFARAAEERAENSPDRSLGGLGHPDVEDLE